MTKHKHNSSAILAVISILLTFDKTSLADAVAELIEALHQKYPGIKTKPVPHVEDEDFTIEVEVPPRLLLDEVESECHKECIRIEDKYDIYILPLVTRKAA